MSTPPTPTENQMCNQVWRLSNAYKIQDKDSRTVVFRPNFPQKQLLTGLHYRNVILKARQLGISTLIELYLLDCALFARGMDCGLVAHTQPIAEDLFRRKIAYPYDQLHVTIRNQFRRTIDNKTQYQFSNGSMISAGVSLRSGTYQNLHVSELGRLAKIAPDRAREVKTGSIETVPMQGIAFIESTAQGRSGIFYDYVQHARKRSEDSRPLSPMDWKFWFFAWYHCSEYRSDPETVTVSSTMSKYLDDVELKTKVKLSRSQRAWYATKAFQLGDDVYSEYPSTPDEAFEAANMGAYWSELITQARREGRISDYPYDPTVPVETWWDLGQDDVTAIWFSQDIEGKVRFIDYFEASGAGFGYYAQILKEKGYRYGTHNAPHDISVREFSGKSRWEQAYEDGIKFNVIPRVSDKLTSINAVRRMLPQCVFNERTCDQGLIYLDTYRREWDESHGVWKDAPYHGVESNAADAFQQAAMGHSFEVKRSSLVSTIGR